MGVVQILSKEYKMTNQQRRSFLESALQRLTETCASINPLMELLDIPSGSYIDGWGNLYDPHTLYKCGDGNVFDRGTHIKREATAIDMYYFGLITAIKQEIMKLSEQQERQEYERLEAKYGNQ